MHHQEVLAPFHARLRAPGTRPVHILQIGDSHTSADAISNGIRVPLQALLGNGGRGVVAAGRPYQNYVTWNVTASQSGGWTANSWTNSTPASPPLGLAGFTQTARAAGETIGLAADAPEHEFDRLVLCALAQPGGGTIVVRVGGEERRWSLAAPRLLVACHAVDSAAPAASASVTTEDAGPVTITSLATFRRGGGAVLSNLGVIGAQLAHFGRSDERVMSAELNAYRPDLVIIAFGTNEGFDRRVSPRDYEAGLRAQIVRIRRLAGANVPILLVGAPDAATRDPAPAGGDCGEGYYTPALLGQVRARQREVARAMGLAFWDWEAAMGGRCASRAWHRAGLMRDDHIHFTREGGDRIGRLLFADLMRTAPARVRDPR
ncbi:MAG TPA: GDSL-type esterase/lipase family protein [Allosphingosinicella sp.]|nr:GDSL-type esterase/lipase family protein [Allosphingosinicella sp.]